MFDKFAFISQKVLLNALNSNQPVVGIMPLFNGSCKCGKKDTLIIPVFEFQPDVVTDKEDFWYALDRGLIFIDPLKQDKYLAIKEQSCFDCLLETPYVKQINSNFISYLLLHLAQEERVRFFEARNQKSNFWWAFHWGFIACTRCGKIFYPDFDDEKLTVILEEHYRDLEEEHKCL